MNKRYNQIIQERKKGKTLKEIGKNIGVTQERIRQILNPLKSKTCKIHKIKFLEVCHYCSWKKLYSESLKELKDNHIEIEGERLSSKDRNLYLIIQRCLFIKYLKDKKKMSYRKIAKILDRDHTSIISLYQKQI